MTIDYGTKPKFHLSRPQERLWLVLLGLTLTAAPARAGEAVVGYTGGLGGYVNGVGGWSFQPQQNISVTALGSFEGTLVATGEPIAIGLWAADGSLLASNTITATSSFVNQSRYEPVDPLALWAGQTYSIGAYAQGGPSSSWGSRQPRVL